MLLYSLFIITFRFLCYFSLVSFSCRTSYVFRVESSTHLVIHSSISLSHCCVNRGYIGSISAFMLKISKDFMRLHVSRHTACLSMHLHTSAPTTNSLSNLLPVRILRVKYPGDLPVYWRISPLYIQIVIESNP